MAQSSQKLFTFEEFLEFLEKQPENIRYELHDRDIIQISLSVGDHEKIVAFLTVVLAMVCGRLNLQYGIPRTALVRPENKPSGYYPDILILNLPNLENEPQWAKNSTVSQPASIPLVIEVVSTAVASSRETRPTRYLTNWRDDYHKKFADYVRAASRREEMKIPEYWIIDYAALGSKVLIGDPKQPTITIYSLNDEGEYHGKQFREGDRIKSPTFPDLNLTAGEIFRGRSNQIEQF